MQLASTLSTIFTRVIYPDRHRKEFDTTCKVVTFIAVEHALIKGIALQSRFGGLVLQTFGRSYFEAMFYLMTRLAHFPNFFLINRRRPSDLCSSALFTA